MTTVTGWVFCSGSVGIGTSWERDRNRFCHRQMGDNGVSQSMIMSHDIKLRIPPDLTHDRLANIWLIGSTFMIICQNILWELKQAR